MLLASLKQAEQAKDTMLIYWSTRAVAGVNFDINEHKSALAYARRNQRLLNEPFFKRQKDLPFFRLIGYMNLMGSSFARLGQLDSSFYYQQLAFKTATQVQNNDLIALAASNLGSSYLRRANYKEAFYFNRLSAFHTQKDGSGRRLAGAYLGLASVFERTGLTDSALYYGKQALSMFQKWKQPAGELSAASFLNELYQKQGRVDSAYKYLSMAKVLNDSLYSQEKIKQIQNIQLGEALRKQQAEQEHKDARLRYETKLKLYSLLGGVIVLLFIAFMLHRNNQQKQKANLLLQRKNIEIDEQRDKAEKALAELKFTQAQLVQSEKMASLGELTAGIAHEIQNPLNFVNNFSEVSAELLDEAKGELSAGNPTGAMTAIDEAKENLKKVVAHGKRADAIVKGMLQHSRASTGEKQPTDINAMVDEFLRLSYHGMKTKEQTFTAAIQTNLDRSIGEVNAVPQDLGRVMLNLFNNAFYAVQKKKELCNGTYEPEVVVSTRKANDKVEIQVSDNGTGIPQKVVDKIFQPFFTTKPTGEGTGLGLSLSYDIIKAHAGELKVETKEDEGARFTVVLPLKQNHAGHA
jgi:signal transduction histidine kinase